LAKALPESLVGVGMDKCIYIGNDSIRYRLFSGLIHRLTEADFERALTIVESSAGDLQAAMLSEIIFKLPATLFERAISLSRTMSGQGLPYQIPDNISNELRAKLIGEYEIITDYAAQALALYKLGRVTDRFDEYRARAMELVRKRGNDFGRRQLLDALLESSDVRSASELHQLIGSIEYSYRRVDAEIDALTFLGVNDKSSWVTRVCEELRTFQDNEASARLRAKVASYVSRAMRDTLVHSALQTAGDCQEFARGWILLNLPDELSRETREMARKLIKNVQDPARKIEFLLDMGRHYGRAMNEKFIVEVADIVSGLGDSWELVRVLKLVDGLERRGSTCLSNLLRQIVAHVKRILDSGGCAAERIFQLCG
jgi:uncharacterized protein Yka (UPF0111/DUF47 family)